MIKHVYRITFLIRDHLQQSIYAPTYEAIEEIAHALHRVRCIDRIDVEERTGKTWGSYRRIQELST